MNFIRSKLGWKGDYSCVHPLCFANHPVDIPSLSSQSECTRNTIQDILSLLSSQSEHTKQITSIYTKPVNYSVFFTRSDLLLHLGYPENLQFYYYSQE